MQWKFSASLCLWEVVVVKVLFPKTCIYMICNTKCNGLSDLVSATLTNNILATGDFLWISNGITQLRNPIKPSSVMDRLMQTVRKLSLTFQQV